VTSLRIAITPRLVAGQRLAVVDELKGLALVLVLIYHCGGVLGAQNVVHGEIGVDIFLIISGMALAINSADAPLRQFFLRRFLRIYPSYWIALCLFLWMHHRYLGVTRPWASVWRHILGIHGFFQAEYFTDIVDAFWFISMIVAAYLVFACIRRRLDNLSLLVAVAGVLTVLAAVSYQDAGNVAGLIHLAIRIPSFFVGVIAGRLLGSGTAEVRFNPSLGLGLLCFYYLTFFRSTLCDYTIPAIGVVLAWVGTRKYLAMLPLGDRLLRAFALLGVVSYEVYLFHQPLVRDYNLYFYHVILHNLAPTRGQLLIGIFVALAITLVVSVGVHLLVGRLFSFWRRPATQGVIAEAPYLSGRAKAPS
jgi:peptidoglycan/LPS O-acetylase OafA/YrhL